MSESDEREQIRQRKLEELKRSFTEPESATDGDSSTPTEPIHISGANQLDNVVRQYDVVLTDFYADWCGPCQMIAPVITELAAETPAAVAKVDIDANQSLAARYQVQGVPTLILFAGGDPVERVVGVRGKNDYRQLIDHYTN